MAGTISKLKQRVQQLSKALEQSLKMSSEQGLKAEMFQKKSKKDNERIIELERQLLGKKEEFLLLREQHQQIQSRVDDMKKSTAQTGFIRIHDGVSKLLVNVGAQANELDVTADGLENMTLFATSPKSMSGTSGRHKGKSVSTLSDKRMRPIVAVAKTGRYEALQNIIKQKDNEIRGWSMQVESLKKDLLRTKAESGGQY